MEPYDEHTVIDKKAVLILFVYIWLMLLSVLCFKDVITNTYNEFKKEVIIPNIKRGFEITELTKKEHNDSNKTQ